MVEIIHINIYTSYDIIINEIINWENLIPRWFWELKLCLYSINIHKWDVEVITVD
jgi:hypothetical protein